MNTCAICEAALTGRQRRFCSRSCAKRGYNLDRKADGRLVEQRARHADKRREWAEANKGRYDVPHTCPCGREFQAHKSLRQIYCSKPCAQQVRKGYCKLPSTHEVRRLIAKEFVDQRSDFRKAIEDGTLADLRAALLKRTHYENGCWVWDGVQSKPSKGSPYPVVKWAGKSLSPHRLVAAKVYGPLGKQPVHHVCANTLCLNPSHLQPISHRENIAEMLQRNYYLLRIAELEDALNELDPTHPLLHEAGVPRQAA